MLTLLPIFFLPRIQIVHHRFKSSFYTLSLYRKPRKQNQNHETIDLSAFFGCLGKEQNAASVNFAPKFVILCKILMLLLYKRLCKTSPHSTKSLDLSRLFGILESDRKSKTVKTGLKNAILCKFFDEKRSVLKVRTDLLEVFDYGERKYVLSLAFC